MKENSLAPEQTNDNLVTIKAVAAETKTLLGDDGTSVVWEENDAISVVVEGESDKYLETFTTSSTEKTSIAEFTAVLSNELSADETVTGIGYAVYPATSVTLATGSVSIVHELPEEQNGTITSGMNLSYAKVDADDIKAGETNAVFYNALTLLKVNVPAGVKSVVLTSNILSPALVGKVNFTVNKTLDDISFVQGSAAGSPKRSVTLSNGGAELKEGVHDLLVFPGTANELTLTMTGTDGAVYESTLNAVELVAGTYRTINLTKIFKMGVEDEMFISPAGGECEVKIASVADYTYDVAVTPTAGGNWLSYTLPTKGFHQDVITFSAEENTTGADRTANVTITWGEDQTRTFKMTQRAVYMDFVDDENGDPIQWEENFKLYSDESLESELATFTNVFTIELSDDFSKGTYKLKNLFVVDLYYGEGYQMITNKGGDYYANYDAATGNLTVLKANAVASYNFPGDIVLTYDSVNKTFSAATLTVTLSNGSAYYASGATRYIGGYAAAVKAVDEPETPGDGNEEGGVDAASLAGNYSEEYATFMSNGSGTMTITVLGNDISVSMCNGSLTCSATLSSDGKTLTVNSDGVGYQGNSNDPFSGNTVLNISNVEGKIKLTLSTSTNLWGMSFLTSYTATKN